MSRMAFQAGRGAFFGGKSPNTIVKSAILRGGKVSQIEPVRRILYANEKGTVSRKGYRGDSQYRILCYCTMVDIAPQGSMSRLCTRVRLVSAVSDVCTVLPRTKINSTINSP